MNSSEKRASGAEQRDLFARVLQQERRIALAITVLAIGAVFGDIAWQSAVPMAGALDLVLQVFMGCAFLGLLAWHLVNPASHIQRALLALVVVTVLGQIGRMYVALFGYGWNNPPDLALPTALGYIPLLVISTFAFLPQRAALKWAGSLMLIVMLPTGVYVAAHLHYMSSSPRLIDLAHTALLQTPITFLVGLLIMRVHSLVAVLGQLENRVRDAAINETDATTMTFNRAGLGRVLEESVESAQLNHREMTVGFLELCPGDGAGDLDAMMRHAIHLLRQEFPTDKLVVGRWSAQRLMLLIFGDTVAPSSRPLLQVLEALNLEATEPGTRLASLGLAAYHPGETTAALLKRTDDQLQDARRSSGLGLAFSGRDAF